MASHSVIEVKPLPHPDSADKRHTVGHTAQAARACAAARKAGGGAVAFHGSRSVASNTAHIISMFDDAFSYRTSTIGGVLHIICEPRT